MSYVTKLKVLEGQRPVPKSVARRRAELVGAAARGVMLALAFAFGAVGFATALRWIFIIAGAPL